MVLSETFLRNFNRSPSREERVNLPATGGEGQGLERYGVHGELLITNLQCTGQRFDELWRFFIARRAVYTVEH